MSHIFKTKPLLILLASICLLVYACKKDDDTDSTRISLLSFGPSPVLRGGELRFIGHHLDQVTAIILPDNVEVTAFKTKTPELLVIEVPEATVDGKETPIFLANEAFKAIAVPAGTHEVVFSYHPARLFLGFRIAGATLIIIAGILGYGVWRARINRAITPLPDPDTL